MSDLTHAAGADRPADAKRARILESALKVVLAYGYSRTTMDDLAREAGISRPALYLLFRNKADIYRAVCSDLLNVSLIRAREALASGATLCEKLEGAIEQGMLCLMDQIAQSPHGAELVDMKTSLAMDIVARWREEFAQLLSAAICEEAARIGADLKARGLSARAMADMLLDGLEGMKARTTEPQERRAAAKGLVRVIVLALEA